MLDKMPRNPTKGWWDRLMEIEGILMGKKFRATKKMNGDLKRSQCVNMNHESWCEEGLDLVVLEENYKVWTSYMLELEKKVG